MLEAQLFQMTNWGTELEQVIKRLQHHAPALYMRQTLQAQVPASSFQALHQVLREQTGECFNECTRRIVQNDAAVEVSGAPSCSGGLQHDILPQAAGLLTVEQSLKLVRRVHPQRLHLLQLVPHVERPGEVGSNVGLQILTLHRLWASRRSKASAMPASC